MSSNILTIPVKSSTSDDEYYVFVTFNEETFKLEMECTCGLKFKVGMRKKCKHITSSKSIVVSHLKTNSSDLLKEFDKMSFEKN